MAGPATDPIRKAGGLVLAALAFAGALGAAAPQVCAQPWSGGGRGWDRGGGFEPAAYQGRGERYGGYRGAGDPSRYGGPGPSGAPGWRRGQVLPPDYRDRGVADPGRYHLRAPPSGYGWVGDERNAYLMQRSTGMVLDAVPGAYDPAPRYAPRDRRRGRR